LEKEDIERIESDMEEVDTIILGKIPTAPRRAPLHSSLVLRFLNMSTDEERAMDSKQALNISSAIHPPV